MAELNHTQRLDLIIKQNFANREEFAKRIGLTRQALNYHYREAEKNEGKFSIKFQKLLKDSGIDIFAMKIETGEISAISVTEKQILRDDSGVDYVVHSKNMIIEAQKATIDSLQMVVKQLQKQLEDCLAVAN